MAHLTSCRENSLMSADLLQGESRENPRPVPTTVDHPWRMTLCTITAVCFLLLGLMTPQLPNLFAHARLGWMLSCFLLASAAMAIASRRMDVRLIAAALGTVFTLGLFQSLVQYDLIGDVMAYRSHPASIVWQETLVGTLVFAPMMVLHVARIESHLEGVPLRLHSWEGTRMGLLQSAWLTLVVVLLLFAGPMLNPLNSTDTTTLAFSGENPWLLLAIGGSLSLAGALSGAIAAWLGTTSIVGRPAGAPSR